LDDYEQLAVGIREAHDRLVVAFDNLPRGDPKNPWHRGSLAVVTEVTEFLARAADVADELCERSQFGGGTEPAPNGEPESKAVEPDRKRKVG